MKIAELWAKQIYNGNTDKEIPIAYAEEANSILAEMSASEDASSKKAFRIKKINELEKICNSTIFAGKDITLSDGTVERFTLDEYDQLNLSGIALKLIGGAKTIAWHKDDETSPCRFYSATDGWTIINTLTAFKEYHITYFRDLRIYVNSLQSIEEINAITYGFELPSLYKSAVLIECEEKQLGA